MQYIQFQGQIASQIPTPPVGSVNLFIDANNNNFGTTNENGEITVLGGLTTITKVELDTLISTSALTSGYFYQISGASQSLYGGTNIIIQAVANNKITKKGTGLFYNPKYSQYDVWNNNFRLVFDTLSGPFLENEYITLHSNETNNTTNAYIRGVNGSSHMVIYLSTYNDTFFENPNNLISLTVTGNYGGATCNVLSLDFTAQYAVNDKAIWGNKVWKNLTGVVGIDNESYLDLNGDWVLVPYNETDYDLVANEIEYDYLNDYISFRTDGSNFVRQDYDVVHNWWGANNNQIKYFPWGHPQVNAVTLTNAYSGGLVNLHNTSRIFNVSVEKAGELSLDYSGKHITMSDITIESWGSWYANTLPYNNRFEGIKISTYGDIVFNTFCDNDTDITQLYDIEIGVNGRIYSNLFYSNSNIYNTNIGNNSNIDDLTFYPNSRMFYCTIGGSDSYLGNITLLDGSEIKYLTLKDYSRIQNGTLDISSCLKRVEMGPETYLTNFTIGLNSFIRQINMDSRSNINDLIIGAYSNYQNIDLGPYNNMNYIRIGDNSNIQNIDLNSSSNMNSILVGNNSNFENITLNSAYIENVTMADYTIFSSMRFSPNSSCYGINLEYSAQMYDFEMMVGANFGEITLMTGATMNNFSVGVNSGFGGFIVDPAITVSYFDLGVNIDFSHNFTVNTSNITMNQSLNNLYTGPIGTVVLLGLHIQMNYLILI